MNLDIPLIFIITARRTFRIMWGEGIIATKWTIKRKFNNTVLKEWNQIERVIMNSKIVKLHLSIFKFKKYKCKKSWEKKIFCLNYKVAWIWTSPCLVCGEFAGLSYLLNSIINLRFLRKGFIDYFLEVMFSNWSLEINLICWYQAIILKYYFSWDCSPNFKWPFIKVGHAQTPDQ